MNIYFVRHGQTISNENKIIQGEDDPLTSTGIDQAKKLAERFKEIDLDVIYSSPLSRAIDTAKMISNETGIAIEEVKILQEKRNPSKLIGLDSKHDTVLEVNRLKKEQQSIDPHWKFEDEEGFLDLKQRALDILKFISIQPHENILVVTHGGIMRYLLACMLFGESLDKETSNRISKGFYVSNTGISKCEFKPKDDEKPDRWKVINWNDVTHI